MLLFILFSGKLKFIWFLLIFWLFSGKLNIWFWRELLFRILKLFSLKLKLLFSSLCIIFLFEFNLFLLFSFNSLLDNLESSSSINWSLKLFPLLKARALLSYSSTFLFSSFNFLSFSSFNFFSFSSFNFFSFKLFNFPEFWSFNRDINVLLLIVKVKIFSFDSKISHFILSIWNEYLKGLMFSLSLKNKIFESKHTFFFPLNFEL